MPELLQIDSVTFDGIDSLVKYESASTDLASPDCEEEVADGVDANETEPKRTVQCTSSAEELITPNKNQIC